MKSKTEMEIHHHIVGLANGAKYKLQQSPYETSEYCHIPSYLYAASD